MFAISNIGTVKEAKCENKTRVRFTRSEENVSGTDENKML